MARQKMSEAEAEVEARYWEKRNADIPLREINQEFESQRGNSSIRKKWGYE